MTRARAELSPLADAARTKLPLRIRRQVNQAIRRITENPDWGAPIGEGMSALRLLNPGTDVPDNSGLVADFSIQDGGLIYAIIYRIKDQRTLIWIEDIRPVFMG